MIVGSALIGSELVDIRSNSCGGGFRHILCISILSFNEKDHAGDGKSSALGEAPGGNGDLILRNQDKEADQC